MMKNLYLLFISLLILSQVQAKDIFVDQAGLSSSDGTTWDKANDLQTAITNAQPGDVVHCKTGTFQLSTAVSINKAITIKAGYPKINLNTDLSGYDPIRNRVVLTPIASKVNGISLLVISASNKTINLEGFHFKNGGVATSEEGAVYLKTDATLNVSYCVFEGNQSKNGAAICTSSIATSDISIDRCFFINNSSPNGGGKEAIIGGGTSTSDMQLSNSVFFNNTSVNGIAIIYTMAQTNIYNSTFANNTGFSTQVYLGSSKTQEIQNSIFFGGGGNYIYADKSTTFSNCAFDNVIAGQILESKA